MKGNDWEYNTEELGRRMERGTEKRMRKKARARERTKKGRKVDRGKKRRIRWTRGSREE